jgi:hypothetical protein
MAGIERGRLECPELGQLGRTVPRLAAGFLFLVIFELAHGDLVAAAAGGRLYSQQCRRSARSILSNIRPVYTRSYPPPIRILRLNYSKERGYRRASAPNMSFH